MKASVNAYPLSELCRLFQSMEEAIDCFKDEIETLGVPGEIEDQVLEICARLESAVLHATRKTGELKESLDLPPEPNCVASQTRPSNPKATVDVIEESLCKGLEEVDGLIRRMKEEAEAKEAYSLARTYEADLMEMVAQVRDLLELIRQGLLQSEGITAVIRALKFSAHKHRDQRRKDAEASPYINHPIEMAEILACIGGITDVITLQGAILHDTIEDTQTSPEELEAEFGAEVRALVEEVSDDKSLPKEDRKRLQIEHAAYLSARAKHIKLADKICNIQDVTYSPPPNWTLKRRQEYLDWAERVVAGCRGSNQRLQQYYEERMREGRQILMQ
jgi:guanosine-3',5'-bis(diphosphate) 3'-pyrophosphohydrolase